MELQQAHSSLRSGENQSEVEGLRCENSVLRALVNWKLPRIEPVIPRIPQYAREVLEQFNGAEISGSALRGNRGSISMALTQLTRKGLLKRTRLGFYQKVSP